MHPATGALESLQVLELARFPRVHLLGPACRLPALRRLWVGAPAIVDIDTPLPALEELELDGVDQVRLWFAWLCFLMTAIACGGVCTW